VKVLFVVIPEKGHVNPYIGPAQALVDLDADVAFFAPADISAQLAAAGLAFVGPRDAPAETPHRGAEFAARVRDPVWLRRWIVELLVDAAEADIAPMREVVRRERPDVVAIDPMVYGAAIACELEGVPWAAVSNSLNPALPAGLDSELLRTVAHLAPARAALFARHGVTAEFRGCDVLSPQLTIAFCTEALVGAVPDVALVGPSRPRRARGDECEFPWSWLDAARPLVYASCGSQVYHQPRLFAALVEATAGRGVQLVLSVGELDLGALPPHVLARSYVPQLAVLSRASAFVTHGGANSVMEAIGAGVPVLITPLCNDQFHQAHFVARAGVGRVLDPDTLTAASAWEALAALLAEGPERRAAAAARDSYTRDGAGEAARLISELAARSRPVRAS
jgi:zeaxanthin glucosyltransferase